MSNVSIDFTPIVREINRNMAVLGSQISEVQSGVGSVSRDLDSARSELLALRTDFEEFLARNERQRLVQLAETKIGGLKAQLDRDFGHYNVVRRTSVGILQAFDIGNVRVGTIHDISEELMIQTPRYWLAPALVALAAWSKDDEDLARRSVEAAFSRDPKKTSLFFALVLRRQARLGEARRWLHHYFVSLDPRALTREFSVLLEATAQEGFGAEGRQLVGEHLAHWGETLRDEPEIVATQVAKWLNEIEGLRGSVPDSEFAHLSKFSPDWLRIQKGLEAASAHQYVVEKYSEVRDAPVVLSANVADRLDDLLDLLVTEFDGEELPLRREVLAQEAIIAHDGDATRAQQQADLDISALDERIDALSLQTHTAFRPDLFGVSVSTQRVAVGSSVEDFTAAVGQFTRDYRAGWPDKATLTFTKDHSNHAGTYGFDKWTTTTSTPQVQAEESLTQYWGSVMLRYIESQRFGAGKIVGPIVAGAIGLLIGLLFLNASVAFGILVILASVGIAVAVAINKKKACDRNLAAAEEAKQVATQYSVDLYRGAAAEWVDARLAFDDEDAKESELLALVEGWPR